MTLALGSLCTGYGGLDLAVDAVLGTHMVWLSELDKNPAAVCAARFPGVLNLGDLTAVEWTEVEPIDVLTAGYPCQPFSQAGRRQGANDARHLWPHIADAVRLLRPRLIVLENVAGHLDLGFDTVLGDLAALGFDAEWVLVRASDVGACHRRERLFIVARDTEGHDERDARQSDGGSAGRAQEPSRGSGGAPADADGRRCEVGVQLDSGQAEPRFGAPRRGDADGLVEDAPDAYGTPGDAERGAGEAVREPGEVERSGRCDGVAWGEFEPAIRRHEAVLGRSAPAPVDGKKLSAPFVEWLMMLPSGWVTDVLTSRTAALKCLGNGVVPPQAAYAIAHLLDRAAVAA